MTNNSSLSSHRWLKLFLKTGGAIGLGIFLLGIIGLGCGQWWAKEHLAPIIAQELTKGLKRPVEVGKIKDIWLNEIRVDNASIPAHGNESNRLSVREIVVKFNPIKLALDRTLKLDIRVVSPSVYLPQTQQGKWIDLPQQQKKSPGAVKVELESMRIENANVTVVPYSKIPQPIQLSQINFQANANDNQSRFDFNGGGQFAKTGIVSIQGNSLIANGRTQLVVNGQKIDAAAANRIVKIPEVDIINGTVDGDLNLAIQPQKYLHITSNLAIRDGRIGINHLPRSLDAINGSIEVSEREVKFKHVATKYDRVNGIIDGTLNYNTGYQLSAKTPPISLPDILKSIDVKSPFPLAGGAVADLQLTGKLDRPILSGQFNNSQPSRVDRVLIDRVNGNFKLADGRIKIDAFAQPKLGGKITTQGEIQLLKTPQTRFQVQGKDVPGDLLARLYGAKLPPQMRLGNTAVAGTIGGVGENIATQLLINTPQSTYPGSANLQITPQGKTIVRGATIQTAAGNISATGEVTATNWRLNLHPHDLDTHKLAQIAGLTLPANYGGKLGGNIQVAGLNQDTAIDRIKANGNLNLQLAAGKIIADRVTLDRGKWQANLSSNELDLQELDRNLPAGLVSGNFDVNGNGLKNISPQNIVAKGRGKVKLAAGEIQSENLTISNGNWQGLFTANNLQLSELSSPVAGKLSGTFNLAGNLNHSTPESIQGVGAGTIDLPQGKIIGNHVQIERGKWQGNFQTSGLSLDGLAPEIPHQFRTAKLDSNVNIAGNLQQLQPQNITVTGDGKLSLAGGTIIASQLAIKAGKWQGNFGFNRLKLASVSDEIPGQLGSALLNGNFAAAGDLTKFNPDRLQVAGDGELNIADGKIRARNLKLDRGNWSSNLAIANLKLGNISNQLSPQLQAGKMTGNLNISGNLNRLNPGSIQANGDGKVKLANGGEIAVANFQLGAAQWQSDLTLQKLGLGLVNKELPQPIQAGLLSGKFYTAGNLQYPEPAQIQVTGNGKISHLLGGNILLNNLTIERGKWQSKVIADRLNLGELAKFAPKNSFDTKLLAGRLNANWQVDGDISNNNPANLRILGETKLTNFQIGSLKFNPNLTGNTQANPGQGVDVNFTGITDRLALSLDRNLQLQSFSVDRQGIIARGNVSDRILDVNVERLPINLFQQWIPPSAGIQQYRLDGTATGNLAVNLANFQISGKQLEITNPIFGAFQGDRLLANFNYYNGKLQLNDTEIQHGANTYLLNASAEPTATTPTFQAKLQVPKGSIEDVRNLLQIFSISDVFTPLNRRNYGTVADLFPTTQKIANSPQTLKQELKSLSELRRWLNHETNRQQAINSIPDLGDLQGDFSGDIAIASNPQTGLSADFNLNGSDWQLERYHVDRLKAVGNWRDGQLQLDPLSVKMKNTQMNLAGKFAIDRQNAQLKIQNFPAKWFANLTELPVDINGGINLTAGISGSLGNPHISGNVEIDNGQLNHSNLQSATGNFNYWDGRLNFASNATLIKSLQPNRDDVIKITGSIPYQLPFTLKAPLSNDLRIDLSLQNRGLQILDVLSKKQLQWIDGQGKIALKIDGKMKPEGGIDRISANGRATIVHGKIQNAAIPNPVTDVNGDIVFDFDRIDIEKLTGKLDRGNIAIAGIIPIADNFSIEPSQQLNILINGINVNLKEKYSGDVNGNLKVLGTAVNPILTGELKLSNGQILLADSSPSTTTTILGIKDNYTTPASTNSLQLRNLHIILSDNLQIIRAPILNFFAKGQIDIDGTLDDPRPFGQVQLQKGSVNLFSTQFRLASGPQTADFFPNLKTDPVLNIRLYTKLLESVSNNPDPRNAVFKTFRDSEINQPAEFYTTSLGSVRTIQVEARIAGLASQLTQRLELTSSPVRNQEDIVTLLSGGLAERLKSGDNIGIGIANLAGSSLLNTLQDRISDVLSLSDFRLFPTTLGTSKTSTGKSTSNSNSTFGIAAEVGTEIAPNLSTSVFKILTNNEPLYYNLRYRLNDQMLLRGSTNLYGENRAVLEFEQRF